MTANTGKKQRTRTQKTDTRIDILQIKKIVKNVLINIIYGSNTKKTTVHTGYKKA